MKPSILCVDDDTFVRLTIRRCLQSRFLVHVATGGAEALEIFKRSGPFPVVVVDMQMPGMDGVRLLNELTTLASDTVAVVVSARPDAKEVFQKETTLRIAAFLRKPFRTQELQDAATAALALYQDLPAVSARNLDLTERVVDLLRQMEVQRLRLPTFGVSGRQILELSAGPQPPALERVEEIVAGDPGSARVCLVWRTPRGFLPCPR